MYKLLHQLEERDEVRARLVFYNEEWRYRSLMYNAMDQFPMRKGIIWAAKHIINELVNPLRDALAEESHDQILAKGQTLLEGIWALAMQPNSPRDEQIPNIGGGSSNEPRASGRQGHPGRGRRACKYGRGRPNAY